jgi:hypothetical protein
VIEARAFSRWLTRADLALFPQVPERTRLARLCKTHTAWTARFLAAPTVLGVADTSGRERIHPMREGRSPAQSVQRLPMTPGHTGIGYGLPLADSPAERFEGLRGGYGQHAHLIADLA